MITERINELKKKNNAIILAHYYQTMDIQGIADFVGDSFEMAKKAAQSDAETLVVCGVRFMAESAKLLSPQKTVLLPAPDAGCPMADMITPEDVLRLREEHPNAAVMCYVNSSAAVKAVSDICCTSSSALRVANSLGETEIIFIPDKNLGAYTAKMVPSKKFIFFDGYCPIHHGIIPEYVIKVKQEHPDAVLLVHPECRPEVTELADFVGSTSQILNYVLENSAPSFIIGTELGVVERLSGICPDKKVIPLSMRMTCVNMKKTTMPDVLSALETLSPAVSLPKEDAEKAALTLRRMVEVG